MAVGVLAVSSFLGCENEEAERSVSFRTGEEIPLGIINVTVNRWENAYTRAPLRSLDPPPGEKAIAVWVRWSGLADHVEAARQSFAENYLQHSVRVVDSGGFDYATTSVLEPATYHWTGPAAPGDRTRILIFWVWVDSEGYTVRLEHPDPGDEGFDVALVPFQ
jgi:hypothetical protein